MRDFGQRDNRKSAMRALMKNEKLATLLDEAIKSPAGSTSRKRAQKLIGVLKKSGMMDGAGGPGINIPKQNMRLQPRSMDYSNFVIFPSTPPLRSEMPAAVDGAGGPGDIFGFNQQQSPSMSQVPTPLSSNFNFGGSNTPFSQSQGTTAQSTAQTAPSSSGILSRLPSFGSMVKTGLSAVGNIFAPGVSTAIRSYSALNKPPEQPAPGSASLPTLPQQQSQQNPGQQTQDQVLAAQQQAIMAQQGAYSGGGQSGGGQQQGGGISSMYPGIQGAVNSGMGPSMFAYQAMAQGPEYLKNLPGFAGLPDSALGGAPTLSGRIEQLDKSLRQTYRLDEMLNQYMGLVDQGVGLEGRLSDYIRGRDEFLNETDGMLESFKDDMLKMNLADPETRQSAQMYSNYLYELRGRQNKRYIEFLNTSIDEYNGKLQSVGNMYTTALDNYQRELTMKSAITQEEYNLMFGALTDMYNTVAEAPMKALEMQKMQAELYAAQVRAAKDVADMSGTSGDDYWDDLDKLKKAGIIDANGRWNPNTSIDDAETYAALGVNPTHFFTAMTNVGRNSLTLPDKDGITMDMDGIMSTSGSLLSNLNRLAEYGSAAGNDQTVTQAFTAAQEIRDATANALFANGVIKPENGSTVREAVNYLSTKNPGIFNVSKPPSRTQFLDTFKSSGLDNRFLDALYTDFEGYSANPREFGTYFLNEVQNGTPLRQYSDPELASRMAYTFADKLGWGSR